MREQKGNVWLPVIYNKIWEICFYINVFIDVRVQRTHLQQQVHFASTTYQPLNGWALGVSISLPEDTRKVSCCYVRLRNYPRKVTRRDNFSRTYTGAMTVDNNKSPHSQLSQWMSDTKRSTIARCLARACLVRGRNTGTVWSKASNIWPFVAIKIFHNICNTSRSFSAHLHRTCFSIFWAAGWW